MSVRRLAESAVQPSAFAFTPENAAWAKQVLKKYPEGREQSAVIPLMMRAQEQDGWVTKAAIEAIADMLGMPYIRALEVATFYTQFQLKPVGTRAHVQVCGTTPCMLRGSEALMDVCRSKIHHDQLHTNASGTLSWEEVECQGACVNAPMVMIFKDAYEDLTPERLSEIIDQFEAGNGASVKPGPQNGRVFSAPLDGLTSLKDENAILKSTRDREAKAADREARTVLASDAAGTLVPPSKAAKPKTHAAETNGAVKSPSPVKVSKRAEDAASAAAPAIDPVAANKAAESVEKVAKQRKSPTTKVEPAAAFKSPELPRGEALGPSAKRAPGETPAPQGAPSPEGGNMTAEGKPLRTRRKAETDKGGDR
jgi:NADH-quinone oxidoreductase subunit E